MRLPVVPAHQSSTVGMLLWLSVFCYLISLYLPICLVPLFSFNDSIQAAFLLKGFTFCWYRILLRNEGVRNALIASLKVGLTSAAIATACETTIAYAAVFITKIFSKSLSFIVKFHILTPGVIIGIAMLSVANLMGICPSISAIIYGHILLVMPATVMVMHARFSAISRSIPEAVEDLGAREWTLMRRILLPMAASAIGSAFMLAFLTSFDEVIIAFFLTGSHPILPVYIWGQLRFPKSLPIVMALGSVILVIGVVVAILSALMLEEGRARNHLQRSQWRGIMTTDRFSVVAKIFACSALALSLVMSSLAHAEDRKLSYLTWSGYELPEYNEAYLKAHPDSISISMFDDDDDAFTKLKAGFHPDLAHPCYDKIARWQKAGMIEPIDTTKIKNWNNIFPIFRNLPDIQAGDGKVWMVPWDWGNTSILYRVDLLPDAEQSWNLLWDKRYAGRMATIDAVHDTSIVAALVAGVNPFDLSPADLEKVANKLREQRPLTAAYTTDMTSVEQSLASGTFVAAMTWNASAVTLKKQGVPVAFMRPREGMLTWACGFVFIEGMKNKDLAYDFINSRLEAASGKHLIENNGYGASTSTAFAAIPAEKLKELELPANPEDMLKKTIFTGPMKQAEELGKMLEKIKAGG
ncbi:MAG: extracellular solute-binding protein [Acetobacter aceti]|nr:extracellular solute-binding protein [Acetobacter aceti]